MDRITLGRTREYSSPKGGAPKVVMSSLVGCLLLQGGGSLVTLACARPADGVAPTPVDGAAPTNNHTIAAPQESADTALAVTRARETLRTMGVDPSTLTVTEVKPVTWPDSSLGCPQPGIQYLQMLTPGYRIELRGTHGAYRVHVAGSRAIVCTGTGTGTGPGSPGSAGSAGSAGAGTTLKRPLIPLRGIEAMTQRAKEMLSAAVHAPAEQIRVAGLEPQVWPDTGLGCPSSTPAVPGRVSGYRIMLQHGGREYTFNTDLHRVIACPAIDAE